MNLFSPSKPQQEVKQRSADLEIAYRQMLNMPAWKDLDKLIEKMLVDSNKMVDEVSIKDLTVADVAQARGIRYAVGKIRKHIDNALTRGPM